MKAAARKRKEGGRKNALQVARNQAACILRTLLRGAANRRATASIKSLVYRPSIRNKKATMALTCHTLRYLPIIKDVLESSDCFKIKTMVQKELLYVLTFELLFGKELLSPGVMEDIVLSRKSSLRAALARILVKRKVQSVEELLPSEYISGKRYARVNTLKMDVNEAIESLRKSIEVYEDDMIPGLLVLPATTDLHLNSLVQDGALILQGKSSCMPVVALAPKAGWMVLDACAAPGNKTVQLAALHEGQLKVLACEINKHRLKRLHSTVELANASNVEVLCEDFLEINPSTFPFCDVKAILLDPSCTGSGTYHRRLDHLLPSSPANGELDLQRLEKLASFQKRALCHALSFPAVERIVYSTCSINQEENEDVIKEVLDVASTKKFRLGHAFPQWQHRGLPVFDGAQCLVRVEPSEDMDGFFIALFERGQPVTDSNAASLCKDGKATGKKKRRQKIET